MKSPTAVSENFLDRTPGGLIAFWGLCLAVGGLSALVAAFTTATDGTVATGWHGGFATLFAVLLLPLPFLTLPQLRAQGHVRLGRVAPRSAWLRELDDHRRMLLLNWALAALPLLLLRLLARPAGETWLATGLTALWPAALLAGLMGMSLLAAAAWAGLMSWPWGLAATVALMGLVVPGADGLPGPHRTLSGHASTRPGRPCSTASACSCCWPPPLRWPATWCTAGWRRARPPATLARAPCKGWCGAGTGSRNAGATSTAAPMRA